MKKKILPILITLISLISIQLQAQELYFGTEFHTHLDNREYQIEAPEISKTIFEMCFTPNLTLKWGNHLINAGIDFQHCMGDSENPFITGPQIYYNYLSEKTAAYVGIFSIMDAKNLKTTRYLYSDSTIYFDENIEGFLLRHNSANGFIEFGCDWLGAISATERERFSIFSSGEYYSKHFRAGYLFNMMHFAGSEQVRGVVDFTTFSPNVSYSFFNNYSNHHLDIKAEWIQTFQQDRKYVGHYIFPNGLQINVNYTYKHIGIDNTAYFGDNLMPYYNTVDASNKKYGNALYRGELYYSTECGFYDRLQLFWIPKIDDNIYLRVSAAFHFTDRYCGWQQLATFIINVDKIKFFNNIIL